MASGGQTALERITKKDIARRLQQYDHPIDCFYFQLSYPLEHWMKKEELEEKITKITDKFLESDDNQKLDYGQWFKFEDCWSLTYFLDAQKNRSKHRQLSSWYKFEEDLDTNVRQELRKKLKEKDTSLPNMHIIIMRACKYVGDESMEID